MGCDIHLTIEYSEFNAQNGEPYWSDFGAGMNPGRDYRMFGYMAQVRIEDLDGSFEPRGKPARYISYGAQEMFGRYTDAGAYMEDEDLHSHSWLTCDEYAQCYTNCMLTSEYGPPGVPWEVIMVTLNAFKERGLQCRVVFAFDN